MGLIWLAGALLWGFAEATLFFLIPDMLLTIAALRFGWRRALTLCPLAALGAVIGGLVMWHWGAHDVAGARQALLRVPAIGPDLLARVQLEIGQGWALHLIKGPLTGTPYKIYAVEAGAGGINPVVFALVSFLARLPRFIATTLAAAAMQTVLKRSGLRLSPYAVLAAAWLLNYVIYFYVRLE
jgi:membrane protein YqaA with SNARE-associated domain